jgi:hypothetical protein
MTEQIWPVFQSHPNAKYIPDSGPEIHGHTVDGGLHRPAPPPKFHVEFIVMDAEQADPVHVEITAPNGRIFTADVTPENKFELDLEAGAYVRRANSERVKFDVDKPERFDVLSLDSEPL